MPNALALLAYLDPGENDPSPWRWVIVGIVVVVLLLLVIYALTRFVAWAARR